MSPRAPYRSEKVVPITYDVTNESIFRYKVVTAYAAQCQLCDQQWISPEDKVEEN